MIRFAITVTYLDGREDRVEGGSTLWLAWERYALRHGYPVQVDQAPNVLSLMVMAHAALKVEQGFDPWCETVAGIEDAKVEAVPPTLQEASSGSDASSPSSSAGDPPSSPHLRTASSRP